MTLDHKLLELLVCPICKGPLEYQRTPEELICHPDGLAFPVRDGLAVMLECEARSLSAPPPTDTACSAPP
jgi:uncharacterized protein YbaR (Trm112 family)